jgi:DNA-directed RNA polymerase subunit RPC12/RpoP
MVLEPKQTTVAYRCTKCGAGVMSVVGLFNLKADMVKLKCDCGGSEMSLVYTKDSKVRFTVPCLFCPTPHNFTVSSKVFFENELFLIPCPYTDVNICFLGNIDKVRAELDRTELELLDMLGRFGLIRVGTLELDDAEIPIYHTRWNPYFLMLLQVAYYCLHCPNSFYGNSNGRYHPPLKLD